MGTPATLEAIPDREADLELQSICRGLEEATEIARLESVAGEIRALVRDLIGRMPAETLTRLISALNDSLTRRVIELASAQGTGPGSGPRPEAVRWCWIALGSEGRQEQTLASDQDNGIVFAADNDADTVRNALMPLALRINQALCDCGFPLCQGQVMACNPRCCLSLDEWQRRFADWIIEGDPQALLNATIFFDLRPLYGACEVADALIEWLALQAADNPRFLLQMSDNALRRHPPLGLLRDFVIEKSGEFIGTIDLKLNAATLFVDAARIYGLACGARASNTADRLRLAAEAHRLPAEDAEASIKAFHVIQMLRLEHQKRAYRLGQALHNHVDPYRLHAAERSDLVDALRCARFLQKRLAMDYPGTG
jgi:CBS domain-containing protein